MKHTIEGCLIKYNEPTVMGNYFSPGAFKDVTGTMVPVSTNFIFDKSESKIIGYAMLEDREDGVYYKALLNDEEATDDMIDRVKNHDYFLGMYANKIKHDPKNGKSMVNGKIRAMAFTPKCDNAACVLSIDNEPLVTTEGSEIRKIIYRLEHSIKACMERHITMVSIDLDDAELILKQLKKNEEEQK